MTEEKEILEEISQLKGLQNLVRAYEEIASTRMKKERDSVLKNRIFLREINVIFEQVRKYYAQEVRKLAKKRGVEGKEKITFLAHNGKTVIVYLSANTGLFGDIIHKTFDEFLKDVRTTECEVTIVGRYGLALFQAEEPDRPYTYFDLSDDKVVSENIDKVIRHIVQYEAINVYYGEFLNVVSQKPNELTISAEISLEGGEKEIKIPYIFEPSLENLLKFFETEIFASLFDQTARENQLAKFASRVMAMNQADDNIIERLNKLSFERLRTAHKVKNRKQLNSMASIIMR